MGAANTLSHAQRQARALGGAVVREPWLLTAALCAAVALGGVRGEDFPAALYRTWLFRHHGPALWSDQWYGGHLVAGYSPLFPPLAALLGTMVVGIGSCIGSTAMVTALVRRGAKEGHTVGLLWFAAATVADFLIGRLPFALGLMFGAGALLATQRRRPVLAAVAALLCSLASPLAGLFLVLIGLAWAPSLGWRRTLPLAAAAAGVGGTALLGGGGGPFPFPWSSFVAILVFVGGGLALSRGAPAAIKRLLVIYAVAAVALFVVPNPVGGNLDRLGTDCAGPVAAVVLLANHRKRALAVAMPGLLFWQLGPVTGAVAAGASDPSTHAAYYAGLLDYLGRHNAPLGRLEIPLTRDHWETSYVARDYPLARGWERQLDLAYNPVFYQPELTPQDYREWLLTTSVQYVALPDVALDPSSLAEAKILSARQPWLAPVWHDAHWRVWRVVGAEPLVGSGASLTSFGVDALTLRFAAPTTTEVRVHYNQFLRASGPAQACVARADDGWTLVSTSAPGTVTVTAELRLPDLSGSTQYCTTPTR